MTERFDLTALSRFKSPIYPFLYMVDDKMAIKDVLKSLPQTYGLETGFGEEPTRVFHIDADIPWILTEPGPNSFKIFKADIHRFWKDINVHDLTINSPLIALNTYSTSELEHNAKVVVYRNLDYREMRMVRFDELKAGQRLIFIVDMLHADGDEDVFYARFLRRAGYDPEQLQLRSHELPELTDPVPFAPDDYVLDVTKES